MFHQIFVHLPQKVLFATLAGTICTRHMMTEILQHSKRFHSPLTCNINSCNLSSKTKRSHQFATEWLPLKANKMFNILATAFALMHHYNSNQTAQKHPTIQNPVINCAW